MKNKKRKILKKIHLINWRCYQDQTISLDTNIEENKHIQVIFGSNGYGKTSLLEAITWCLYGSEVISNPGLNKREYFNRVALQNNPNLEISVELTFLCGDDIYKINRTAKRILNGSVPSVNGGSDPHFYINGEPQTDAREWVETLLPCSCREFFFFDGLEIKRYAKQTQTKEAREAIEKVLGIPAIRNLKEDTRKVKDELNKKLDELTTSNRYLNELKEQRDQLQEIIQTKKDQIQVVREEIKAAKEILESAKEKARQVDVIKEKLQQLEYLEQRKNRQEERIGEIDKQVKEVFERAPIAIMRGFISQVASDLQSQSINTAKRYGSVEQLKKLLNSNICICGKCIDETSRKYISSELKRREEEAKNLNTDSIRQNDLGNRLATLSKTNFPDINNLTLQRYQREEELQEIEQTQARLRKDTEGYTIEDIDFWNRYEEQEEQVREQERKLDALSWEIEDLSKKRDKKQTEIEKLASEDKTTETISNQLKLAGNLYNAVQELIDWRVEERRQTIEEVTTKIYSQVTNKPEEYKGIKISEEYKINVETWFGTTPNPDSLSAGEKEVLAFSLIVGLNLASGATAPLVMDTPFGHLDIKHQKNIIKALPNFPSQVIILATDRDLPPPILSQLKPDIAQIYHIRRPEGKPDISSIELEE